MTFVFSADGHITEPADLLIGQRKLRLNLWPEERQGHPVEIGEAIGQAEQEQGEDLVAERIGCLGRRRGGR